MHSSNKKQGTWKSNKKARIIDQKGKLIVLDSRKGESNHRKQVRSKQEKDQIEIPLYSQMVQKKESLAQTQSRKAQNQE